MGAVDEFLSHLERQVFPGGCFFAAVGAEFNTHPGPVKERIGVFIEEWVGELMAAAAAAQQAGELPADPDPEQLIYEVDALLLMAHAAYTMYGDPALLERARVGLARLLGRGRTEPGDGSISPMAKKRTRRVPRDLFEAELARLQIELARMQRGCVPRVRGWWCCSRAVTPPARAGRSSALPSR